MLRLSENILTPEVRLRAYQNILTCKSQNILTRLPKYTYTPPKIYLHLQPNLLTRVPKICLQGWKHIGTEHILTALEHIGKDPTNTLTPKVRVRTYQKWQNILTCKSQNILTVYVSNENILTPQRCHRMRRSGSTGHYNAGGGAPRDEQFDTVLPSSFRDSRNYTYRHSKLYLQVLQNILTGPSKYTYRS